jgi:hypothetical protein
MGFIISFASNKVVKIKNKKVTQHLAFGHRIGRYSRSVT